MAHGGITLAACDWREPSANGAANHKVKGLNASTGEELLRSLWKALRRVEHSFETGQACEPAVLSSLGHYFEVEATCMSFFSCAKEPDR